MHYYASYVRLVQKFKVLRWEPGSRSKPKEREVDIFELKMELEPGDHLWLMMGSTNAAAALAAFREGAEVHQISFPRISTWLNNNKMPEESEERMGARPKITPSHVFQASQEAPQLFYGMNEAQAEVLEISAAWQRVSDTLEARKAAANLLRSRVYREAVVYGRARGKELPSSPKEAKEALASVLSDLLATKDKQGRKRTPSDPHLAFLAREEEAARSALERICKGSGFYGHLFGDIEGVGPLLGARFIAGIERIERFKRPEDLSNYAGMRPRGEEGRLPSRKRSKGKPLSRSPLLNNACFLLQQQMFQWGRNTPLGQMLAQQIKSQCPFTAEERAADKNLRRQFVEAKNKASIAMTRYFLEKIVWPRWREYMFA